MTLDEADVVCMFTCIQFIIFIRKFCEYKIDYFHKVASVLWFLETISINDPPYSSSIFNTILKYRLQLLVFDGGM